MAVDHLKKFHAQKELVKVVQNSMLKYCQDRAGILSVQGKNTSGFKDAFETVNSFFMSLENTYGEKKPKEVENPE